MVAPMLGPGSSPAMIFANSSRPDSSRVAADRADGSLQAMVRLRSVMLGSVGDPSGGVAIKCPEVGRGTMARSEEHTSELQSLMRISYAVFCLKKKKIHKDTCRLAIDKQ